MSSFTVDAARSLPGPEGLRRRRAEAAERAADAPFPSTDEEVWRYSRVADLDLDAYRPAGAGEEEEGRSSAGAGAAAPALPEPLPAPVAELLDVLPERAATVLVHDGRIVHVALGERWADRGVGIGSLADSAGGAEALGSVADRPPDLFAELNDAFTLDPVLVRVPAGVVLDAPVVVAHWASSAGTATFPRVVVQAGADSELVVVDHSGSDDVDALVIPLVELDAGPAARLRYLSVQELGLRSWQIGSQVSTVGADATFETTAVALGGEYARLRTDCRMTGRGSTGTLRAAYFGEGDQTLDFRTFQDHAAPDTTSTLLFKGAVAGRSRSVYTGLIRVRKDARGTNAFQTNRNIKLSEDAWAESVPNLEIENNDVRCSHASAVGPIDEDQRFYLESRGVPPAAAERLVVAGFFDEVVGTLPAPALEAPLRARIAAKLDRREG